MNPVDLPALPQAPEGPVFEELWQATAFALVLRLSEAGWFTWAEWTAALTAEIQNAQQSQNLQADPDAGSSYYRHWLCALERLCVAKQLLSSDAIDHRQEQWRQAYLNTPHGWPVELPTPDQ